jgi:hypothetical protein
MTNLGVPFAGNSNDENVDKAKIEPSKLNYKSMCDKHDRTSFIVLIIFTIISCKYFSHWLKIYYKSIEFVEKIGSKEK